MKHVTLEIGSTVWWIGLLVSAITAIALLFFARKIEEKHQDKLRNVLVVFFTINFFSFQIYALFDGSWSRVSSLPLHLCALSQVFGIIALYKKNQFAFEFACFFGIAGGINSLLTPEFAHGYDRFYHVQYYVEHAGIVFMPIFLGVTAQMKPRKLSWLKIMLLANGLAVILFLFNKVNGSNYMYVNTKPVAENPLLVGVWPFYIFVLEFVALIHFYIIYLVFHGFKRWI